ncbi:MAG: hypothetical protein LBQ66_03935 [Planctomycetaceae bacterium]|nr:hypothetical protein [Planctomycetaceae bacterium]
MTTIKLELNVVVCFNGVDVCCYELLSRAKYVVYIGFVFNQGIVVTNFNSFSIHLYYQVL